MTDSDVSPWRRFRRRLWWLLLRMVLAVTLRMPTGAARGLGRCLAWTALRARPREKRLALANLALALPEVAGAERERLLALSVRRLGENLADTLAVPRLVDLPGFLTEEPCASTDGLRFMDVLTALADRGNGVILLMGHLGCWELLGAWLAREMAVRRLGPLGAVTGTVHNPAVDRLLQERRRSLGLKVLPRSEGARPMVRHLQAGGVVAVLMDQNTRVSSGTAPFFGHPAPTPAGPVRLSLRYGIPMLPVALARHGEGHRLVHLPPVEPAGRDEMEMLVAANAALEELIRRNPAEWVWFHRRWEN